jgi:bifunctional DNA-binding transcriptional regulator/antitoxin component of YhaV-PrlF toxin-antitoxin module
MTMVQSGRPSHGLKTARVWEIADDMLAQEGRMPAGRAVVDAYLAEDRSRNEGTGFTQFSHWKRAHTGAAPRIVAQASGARARLVVSAEGEIVLPAALVAALGLNPGEAVIAVPGHDELRVEPARVALARARDLVRRFDSGMGSPADELLRERRSEGATE